MFLFKCLLVLAFLSPILSAILVVLTFETLSKGIHYVRKSFSSR